MKNGHGRQLSKKPSRPNCSMSTPMWKSHLIANRRFGYICIAKKNLQKSAKPVLTTTKKSTEFKPAYYARVPVQQLSPQEMDSLLVNGYYRNGLDACASSIRFMGKVWVPAVMLRVRLQDFTWKKRLRKLMRANAQLFRYEIKPFETDEATETLWQRFKKNVHKWSNVPRIDFHLLRVQPSNNFFTYQLSVFDREKLVGFSTFDRGERSINSMEAAYDPDYRKHSLGLYTMLLEIEWCLAQGMSYYYPGFFPKEDPMFSYKLRPGNIEFFRVATAEWLPIGQIAASDWKLDEITEQHQALTAALREVHITATAVFNHAVHKPTARPSITSCALQLAVPAYIGNGRYILLFIHWNLLKKAFQVFEPWNLHPPMRHDTNGQYLTNNVFSMEQHNYFGSFKTPLEVVHFVREIQNWVSIEV